MKKVTLLAILVTLMTSVQSGAGDFEHFVTARGSKLMDGNRQYRFISFNVPTMNYQEDEMAFRVTNPYSLPTEFEMRDVFATVREMGGQVLRIYTIPVRNKNFPKEAPTYVEAPGVFNEEAFKVTDMMLALANEYQVRVIFSLLNNWQWMGGRPNYAEFRGKHQDEFWTDSQLIADFKKTIEFVVNRTNTITGVKYKDDKAILCWETGNELTAPISWAREITRYIKSQDGNHLIMHGYHALDDRLIPEEVIAEPTIDIVTSHHYERNALDIPGHIQMNMDRVKGRKPYLVGEFGFASTSALETVLNQVIAHKEIVGALIWSLRHHRRHGGFYWHSEPLGLGIYKAYHWPGFISGQAYDEINLMSMYRRKAFEIQGKETPPVSIPLSPKVLPIENAWSISWRGSMGASGYNVERSKSKNGPWQMVGYNVSDADVPYFPLFHDKYAPIGGKYYYRVTAINSAGASKPSNIVGPVSIKRQALIDTMKNLGVMQDGKNVESVSGNDRSYKEIINRMVGDYGSEMTYKVPGKFEEVKVYAFENTRFSYLKLYGSQDSNKWVDLNVEPESFVNSESNYSYLRPKLYGYSGRQPFKYIKVGFAGVAQVARVEIMYKR